MSTPVASPVGETLSDELKPCPFCGSATKMPGKVKLTSENPQRRRLLRLERCVYQMLDESQAQYRRWKTERIDQIKTDAGRSMLSAEQVER